MKRFVVVLWPRSFSRPVAAATPTVSFTIERHRGLPIRMVPEQRHDSLGGHGARKRDVEHRLRAGRARHDRGTVLAHLHRHFQRRLDVGDRGAEDRQDAHPASRPRRPRALPTRTVGITSPVAFAFAGTDATSGIAGCSSPSYGGADGSSVSVTGTCTDVAGNASSMAAVVQVRRHPSDGLALRRAAARRQGLVPEARDRELRRHGSHLWDRGLHRTRRGTPARISRRPPCVGSCRDEAGNSAEAGQSFQYDATAPALAKTEAKIDKGVARIGWDRAGDVVEVELLRSPGINGAKSTIVYQGQGRRVRRQDGESRPPLPVRDQRGGHGRQRDDEGGHDRGNRRQDEHVAPRARPRAPS